MIALDKNKKLDNFTSSLQNVPATYRCCQRHIVKQFSLCPSSRLNAETSYIVRKQHQNLKCLCLGLFCAVCTVCFGHTYLLLLSHRELIRLINNKKKKKLTVKHTGKRLCSFQKSKRNYEHNFCSTCN